MSKSLENEYKEAVMNDLPDLWDRIEAALPVSEESSEKETQPQNENVKTANENVIPVAKKKKHKIWPYFAVAAPIAAIALIALVPVTVLLVNFGFKTMFASNTGASAPMAIMSSSKSENPAMCEDNETAMDNSYEAMDREVFAYDCEEEEFAANEDALESTTQGASAATYDSDSENPEAEAEYKGITEGSEEDVIFCSFANVNVLKIFEDENGITYATVQFNDMPEAYDDEANFEKDDIIDAQVIIEGSLTEDTTENVAILRDEEGNYQILVITE